MARWTDNIEEALLPEVLRPPERCTGICTDVQYILRLKESCPDALQIINLRIETSSITKGSAQQVGAVEVHAYATASYAD